MFGIHQYIVKAVFLILILIATPFLQAINAQSINVQTKQTYHYGDYLSVTISVSKITAKTATMRIIDSEGVKSSAIPLEIKKLNTTITTPIPFSSELFHEGKYQIQVEYDGVQASAPFEIIDVGNTVMPFGSNIIVPQWSDGVISDSMFFKFLVNRGIIKMPNNQKIGEKATIPDWYRLNGKWWVEKKISDSEFIKGLQYLVNQNLVQV